MYLFMVIKVNVNFATEHFCYNFLTFFWGGLFFGGALLEGAFLEEGVFKGGGFKGGILKVGRKYSRTI